VNETKFATNLNIDNYLTIIPGMKIYMYNRAVYMVLCGIKHSNRFFLVYDYSALLIKPQGNYNAQKYKLQCLEDMFKVILCRNTHLFSTLP